jgi:integrase/recombinase XerD
MRDQPYDDLSLFDQSGCRKYLNAAERERFIGRAECAVSDVRLFCLVLGWSGARISEVLALTPATIDLDIGVANFRTLKRRKAGVIRQVPLPGNLLDDLERSLDLRTSQRDGARAHKRIWPWCRTTAWRHVKQVMAAADIIGVRASPKGLRHGFGVNAFQCNVPPHLVQRWLGHASLRTTSIYGDVMGPEERAFAARMWPASSKLGAINH